ncbi:ABC-ATPase domain-containing protein [Calderihabitans maritimus]|uniref:ABC transporter ATPase n=1 Tax=Calderihabitans maritimus TaxID=1246530 RepID=A0A1Z5HQ57_9FIRM|nr:ABC-ATPase domain-containing protein [Calderihabitans maritimus]GAW91451.1 ABC transporter ATPase [Calderihabitans maritimus]
MRSQDDLARKLRQIDGKGYKAYKELAGAYQFGAFVLYCDYIQGDPFASPSRVRVRVQQEIASFPKELYRNKVRRVALEDFLTRVMDQNIQKFVRGNRGTGKSGMIAVDRPGQEIIERTSMVVSDLYVEARLVMGLPAAGRRVLGQEARAMFFEELPKIVEKSLFYKNIDGEGARRHVELAEDQEFIRSRLKEKNLVAFVGNGAILPRESGISDKPMRGDRVVKFKSPPSLEVIFETPNSGAVKGMGIPAGITLIVGGGYHGKSTLLRAIERGVYNHIPGDGREFVVTNSSAVKIRAEDGRRIEKVDISPFISNLPYGQDTHNFSTEDASGSTSQAANIMEALEMGTELLLLDEDTSATNFMIRDIRMQQLIAKEKEPITPFIDKVRQLSQEKGVSTIMVIGGSGDYFDVADTVIAMDHYIPKDVTAEAKTIAERIRTGRKAEGGLEFGPVRNRIPVGGFDATRGKKVKIDARGVDAIRFGRQEINLQYVEQLVDPSQTRAVGDIIYYGIRKYVDGKRSLREIIELVFQEIEEKGLDCISPFYGQHPGDYALPRKFEVAAAVNRLRTLRVH